MARPRMWLAVLGVSGWWIAACTLGPDAVEAGSRTGPTVQYRDRDSAQWADVLAGPDRAAVSDAAETLRNGDGAAVHVLVELLAHEDADVQCHAGRILAARGPSIVPMMTLLVEHSPDRDTRLHAVHVLRSFGPDALFALPALTDALFDPDPDVCMEAARTLALIGPEATAAIHPLSAALLHREWDVRAASAEALAAIGPAAILVQESLIEALQDDEPPVRRGAAQALAACGPLAGDAVEPLQLLVADDNLYVRQVAIRALGQIGPASQPAVARLQAALADPAVAGEAAHALERITGEAVPRSAPAATPRALGEFVPLEGWAMQGGSPTRNAVVAQALPEDLRDERHLQWTAALGQDTYGSPVVHGDLVLIGTDNEVPRDPEVQGSRGTLMAFDRADGSFLWQDGARSLGRHLDRFLLTSTTSTPLVLEDRVYYVTAQAELRCLDRDGFRDGVNDGPWQDEARTSAGDADWMWNLDLGGELGVFPHEAPNCSVAPCGDLLLVCTANGVDESHANVPAPFAPSFVGVDRHTGRVVWSLVGPSPDVLHGQWSSPAVGPVLGRPLAFFGGGDGVLYALEPDTGHEVWRLDGNPMDAVWRPGADAADGPARLNLIANPVFHQDRVYAVMGKDPTHGRGPGRVLCVDPAGRGNVPALWINEQVERSVCTPVIHGGHLFVADVAGFVSCLDLDDGRRVWQHDLLSPVWSCLFVAGDRLYVGDEDGRLTVFGASATKQLLNVHEFDAPLYSSPALLDGVLYLASAQTLYAIGPASR